MLALLFHRAPTGVLQQPLSPQNRKTPQRAKRVRPVATSAAKNGGQIPINARDGVRGRRHGDGGDPLRAHHKRRFLAH